ncbi:MAG: flagellar assembly peptidoglycan hydrolase FlgJ [Gammaproteobacteria bacterium]|nr:MAG: flagellar assembly peptidoglycan hydrolase FlgJ [Gammaproteobacteria bacterium]
MTIPAPDAAEIGPRNLFDRQGITNLKRLAKNDSPEAMVAVAQQFETLFVGMLLKSMREASLGEDTLFGSSAQETYQGMFDQQLAIQTAGRGVLGISKLMLQQLQHQSASKPAIDEPVGDLNNDRLAHRLPAVPELSIAPKGLPHTVSNIPATTDLIRHRAAGAEQLVTGKEVTSVTPAPTEPLTADEFLQQIWPIAVATGKRLGVAPEAIAGQAVLESGWGQHTIKHSDGRSSHNIFGIKAGSNWTGDTATVSTLEYKDGVAIRQRATFRAYDSHAAAFADYADFLQQRSWYQQALAQGEDVAGFANGLQQAGYATDPQYAGKITRIAEQIKQQSIAASQS